jgi:Carboxypeptidase regulatory-like domain/TonB dependent receptor
MLGPSVTVKWLLVFALEAFCVMPSTAQTASSSPSSPHPAAAQKLAVTVIDENGLAVNSARVQLQPPPPALPLRCSTDFAGHCEFTDLSPGNCELRVEKAGFYAAVQSDVQVGFTSNVDVTLSHQREAREVVNVVESPPAIDPAQIPAKEELSGEELLDIPYPGPHDYRNALIFMPGVTPDAYGQAHVAGAETYQTLLVLDGFNVTQPTSGALVVQTSIDSFRSVAVTPSREPAEFGKGSGGVMALNTRMGNDHFRFLATDFIPAPQDVKGISLANWTPIYTMSGPIRKGDTWFFDALDGEYDNYITKQLPTGSDFDHVWRIDNLVKLQSNLTTRNIVTASFLSDYFHDPNAGMWALMPPQTTPGEVETAYLGSLKDQYYFRGGALLETGIGGDQYNLTLTPHGDAGYIETILATGGNYYLHEDSSARRLQALANLYLPPRQWHGRHDIKLGTDLDRLNYDAQFLRQPISFLQVEPPPGQSPEPCPVNANGLPIVPEPTCARYSIFSSGNYSTIYNNEASAYAEDRWLITNRLLIEPGVRFDWDEIVRTPLFSPRLAGTYIFDDESNTKLSAGIGITYDATSLGLIHQAQDGQRVDYFFDSNGCPLEADGTSVKCAHLRGAPEPAPIPLPTNFVVDRNTLAAPRYLNWSIALEKKLPQAIFLKLEFIEKRGIHGFAYNALNGAVDGNFFLENQRDDRYYAFTVSLRHRFRQRYEIFGAYTRSRARTNQVFDFSVDLPVLSQQLPGPFPWDTPNRFVGYGVVPFFKLPIVHKVDMVYSAEARTGLPVNATLETGEIYAPDPPGTFRFPTYYTVNLEFEKRIHLFRRYWAVRAGFDNITNHPDPVLSNGIINPPTQPAPIFIDGNGRALDGRIQYLGKE